MIKKQFNIGIFGAGRIARKFASDAQKVEKAQLYAVGSRNIKSAETFQKEFDMPISYGSYEELLSDENVDIIYISTPNSFHKEHVLMCLEAGKAIICEKPFALNEKEVEEMIEAARKYQVFLMEAMWTRYLPSVKKAKEWIDSGKIGKIKFFQGDFGFKSGNKEDIRFNRELGGGALLDVGIYPISFASMIFGKQPEKIDAHAVLTEGGIDEQIYVQFTYGEGQIAQLSASINLETPRNAYIVGESGYIHLPSAWNGKEAYLYDAERNMAEQFKDTSDAIGYRYELEEVISCLERGEKETSKMMLSESLEIIKTLDRTREIVGVIYPTK